MKTICSQIPSLHSSLPSDSDMNQYNTLGWADESNNIACKHGNHDCYTTTTKTAKGLVSCLTQVHCGFQFAHNNCNGEIALWQNFSDKMSGFRAILSNNVSEWIRWRIVEENIISIKLHKFSSNSFELLFCEWLFFANVWNIYYFEVKTVMKFGLKITLHFCSHF